MHLLDFYALSRSRTRESIDAFLAAFTRNMAESAGEYPYPEFSDNPECVFHNLVQLLEYVLRDPTRQYSLYFHSLDKSSPTRSSMLFFTVDGCIVIGATMWCDFRDAMGQLLQLVTCIDAECGYVTAEAPPPLSRDQFREEASRSGCAILGGPSSFDGASDDVEERSKR